MYHLILSFLVWLIFLGSSSVRAAEDHDCGLFADDNIPIITTPNEQIYPQINITTAINNLKSYCCQNNLLLSQQCVNHTAYGFADSPRLYDHLIDVGFTRLDGEPKLYYQTRDYRNNEISMSIDPIAEQWRTRIDDQGWQVDGAIPINLWATYGRYRWFDEQGGFQFDAKLTAQHCKDYDYIALTEHRDVAPGDPHFIWLWERYFLVCHIANCLYPNAIGLETDYQKCSTLAYQRIQSETDYVHLLAITQGMKWMMKIFNSYAQWYVIQDRFNTLFEEITEMNANLTHINNKVSEMTRICSN